jgi:ribosomal protein L7/L12
MNTLREDLDRVKQTGNIAGIKKTSAGASAVQNADYDDPQLYAAYLKKEAAKLSAEQKSELLRMIEAGDKLNAIKYCREWTQLGLKMAKDIVDSYQTCLMDSDVQSMETIMPTVTQPVTPADIPAVAPTVSPETTAAFMSQITAPVTSISGFNFDMPQAGQNNTFWLLRITDKEQSVTDARSLERNIDNALSEIGRKNEEFFVLVPSEPIRSITFMQVCQDKNDVYFHIEAGLTEMNAQGRPKILCKDKLMGWEARNLCMSFYRGDEIYMSDWYELN